MDESALDHSTGLGGDKRGKMENWHIIIIIILDF